MIPHFDRIAGCYDLLIPEQRTERLRRLLRFTGSDTVLDAGGGTGRIAGGLVSLASRLIVGDLSRPMLQQAVRKRKLTAVQCLTGQLPFPSDTFDRILVVDALHHFENQNAALVDLVRVLKPGGRLVIEEPDIRKWPVKLLALAETLMLMRSRFLTPEDIRKLLSPLDVFLSFEYNSIFMWVSVEKRPGKSPELCNRSGKEM
jgi:demethylmenaquinone methyltransferase/2-methoxy-6-polyprenyl-1,4-benzoquinol methylase